MILQASPVDPEKIAANWGWFLALGIVLVILGTTAFMFPFYGTMAGARVFGWIMLASGIMTAVHAFSARGWGGVILQVLIAIVWIVGGFWLLAQPLAGAVTLTLVLIAVLFVQGLFSVIEALQLRPTEGWGWMLASGVASIILGIMLWMKFPSSALWAIGLLFGLSLAINGWSFIALALGARKQPQASQG
ncbi:MAG: HdeD family acid-resistance protein [Hyphomicrobium sp.]